MNDAEAREIMDCLGDERRVFHYFRDRYAFLLLERLARKGLTVADAKRSAFACLIDKPTVREHLATAGNRQLDASSFANAWRDPHLDFSLTLGWWKGTEYRWSQVSRPGWNLVLQLNFCRRHMRRFHKLYRPTANHVFNCRSHPIRRVRQAAFLGETLAWARLDIDLASDTVLIEEIQSDWCREALFELRYMRERRKRGRPVSQPYMSDATVAELETYVEENLKPYAECWDEAVLAAAIEFISNELGVRQVFYHSPESGNAMKRIRYQYPPRSLYSRLPRRFGFTKTQEIPQFLERDKCFQRLYKRIRPVTMHKITLPA